MNPNSRRVYTSISSADKLCISHTESILFVLREWRGSEGLGGLGGVFGYAFFFVKFSLKPNRLHPNVHSCFFFSCFPKDRGEEKCAKVPCSHFLEREDCEKTPLLEREWLFESLFRHKGVFVSTFHIPKGWFAVSLHLSFLAVLLHFLLQLFLLLRGAALLFTSLPASLPV